MAYDEEIDDDREEPEMPANYDNEDEEEDDDALHAEPEDDEEWLD
jgi:hypothetical protein